MGAPPPRFHSCFALHSFRRAPCANFLRLARLHLHRPPYSLRVAHPRESILRERFPRSARNLENALPGVRATPRTFAAASMHLGKHTPAAYSPSKTPPFFPFSEWIGCIFDCTRKMWQRRTGMVQIRLSKRFAWSVQHQRPGVSVLRVFSRHSRKRKFAPYPYISARCGNFDPWISLSHTIRRLPIGALSGRGGCGAISNATRRRDAPGVPLPKETAPSLQVGIVVLLVAPCPSKCS